MYAVFPVEEPSLSSLWRLQVRLWNTLMRKTQDKVSWESIDKFQIFPAYLGVFENLLKLTTFCWMLYLSSYEYVMSCRISTEGQTFLCNTPTCCYELRVSHCSPVVTMLHHITKHLLRKIFYWQRNWTDWQHPPSPPPSILDICGPPAQGLQPGSEERVGPDVGDLTKSKLSTFNSRDLSVTL